MEDMQEKDSPAGELNAADEVNEGAPAQSAEQTREGFIAKAERELAGRETAANAAPAPQTPEQKARLERMEKMISGWPEEDKKLFAAAPENLRELLGKYYRSFHADYTKKTQQAAALRDEVERELQPLRPLLETGRFADMREFASYVSSMRNFEAELARDPLHTLHILARHAGVNPADLAGYSPDPAREAVRPLQAQLEQLRQELSRAKTPPASSAPSEAAGPEKDAVSAFAQASDAQGQKTHPYFDELAPMMALIMRRDGHEDMEKAYREALYSLPKARQELLEKERQLAAAKQAELEKAKRAGALAARTRASAQNATGNRKKRIEDIIAQAEQELAGQ